MTSARALGGPQQCSNGRYSRDPACRQAHGYSATHSRLGAVSADGYPRPSGSWAARLSWPRGFGAKISCCELLCACAACGALYAHVVQRFQHIPAVQCMPVLRRVPKLYFRNPTRDCRLRHRPPAVRRPSRDRSAPSPAKFHRRRVRPQLRESSSYSQTQRLSPTCSEVGTYPANSIYPWSKPVGGRLPFPVANM